MLYLLAVQAAVQISGPYFTPFMLAQERMSYLTYMVLIGICFLGKAIALPMWGRVAHYSGARRLLWIGGTASSRSPACGSLSTISATSWSRWLHLQHPAPLGHRLGRV